MSETGTIERLRDYRKTYVAMLVSSFLSLYASLVLSIDAIKIAASPSDPLSCNINAVLSCGKVASSWQSQLLGFPNSFINALCPWWLLVTGSTITVFATITRVVLLENSWNFAPERQEKIVTFLDKGWGRVIYTGAFASIIIAIFLKYGNTLFS